MKVNWKYLFRTLKDNGVDWKDRRLILNLYKAQNTIFDINGLKKQAKIRKGVRQGCPLSPYLFNIFIEASINELKLRREELRSMGKGFTAYNLQMTLYY